MTSHRASIQFDSALVFCYAFVTKIQQYLQQKNPSVAGFLLCDEDAIGLRVGLDRQRSYDTDAVVISEVDVARLNEVTAHLYYDEDEGHCLLVHLHHTDEDEEDVSDDEAEYVRDVTVSLPGGTIPDIETAAEKALEIALEFFKKHTPEYFQPA